MIKIAYNACYGGFRLSKKAVNRAKELADPYNPWQDVNEKYGYIDGKNILRHDPILIQVIEELGKEASSSYAKLVIEELPDGSLYQIEEYDGKEYIETPDNQHWIRT